MWEERGKINGGSQKRNGGRGKEGVKKEGSECNSKVRCPLSYIPYTACVTSWSAENKH